MEESTESLIRRKLQHGELPRRSAERIWTGYGRGGTCAACGERIDSWDVEYELDFAAGRVWTTMRFHRACAEAWNQQRKREAPDA